MTTCPNCQAEAVTSFCPQCGQRLGVKRITLRDTIRDSWTQVVGFDGFFLRTIRDLTLRPGQVARSYINGIRVRYFGPVAYFFFMITLLLLWLSLLGLDFAELIRSKQETLSLPNNNARGMELITQWIGDNIKWVLFLAVPFQATAARAFLFRKSGFNFVEHMVPLFYVSGHLFWITMMVFTYQKFTGTIPVIFVSVISMGYFGYMYSSLMQYQSRVKAFVKGIGVYLGGQMLFAVTLTIVAVIALIVVTLINPDLLDNIRPGIK